MPIKEYICENNECVGNSLKNSKTSYKIIELLVGMNEEPGCPACGSKLKRIFESVPSINTSTCAPTSNPFTH